MKFFGRGQADATVATCDDDHFVVERVHDFLQIVEGFRYLVEIE